ncbi:MAG: hypothetical protein EBT95_00590 [Verrucomicrobia bacterium]|nr:hypothetical protein [Verrucomicrobiota bacterium]
MKQSQQFVLHGYAVLEMVMTHLSVLLYWLLLDMKVLMLICYLSRKRKKSEQSSSPKLRNL